MKPERIQEEFRVPGEASETVQDFLDEHAGWRLDAGGSRLVRDYGFATARIASAFTQFAAEVAAELDHPCALELRGAELRLLVGGGGVLGPQDVELAAAIAQVGPIGQIG